MPATVELAEYLGDTTLVHLRVPGVTNLLTARADGSVSGLAAGSKVDLVPEADKAIAFDAQGCLVA